MKSIVKSCCCMFAALTTLFGMAAAPRATDKARARKLVWRDEFNGSSLDTNRWNRCEQGKGDWNRHMSVRKDLVEVKNGALVLWGVANKDKKSDPRPFLTGGVQSRVRSSLAACRAMARA